MMNNHLPVQTTRLKIYDMQDSLLLSEPDVDMSGYFEMTVAKNKEYLIDINGKNIFYQYDTIDTRQDNLMYLSDTIIVTKELKVGAKISIERIYFDTDSFSLKPSSFFELNNLAEMLELNPEVKITITGHTDNVGSTEYNLILSKKRAYSVYEYLLQKKIDPSRLVWIGLGQEVPIAPNETEQGRQFNRRIEIEVLTK